MNRFILPLLLLLLITGYTFVFPVAEVYRGPVKQVQARGLILPPVVMKLLVLEFKTVTADFLFARASQYYGGMIESREQAKMGDLQWLYRNLLVITELDPYFEDPYYFGNALLMWDAGTINQANHLLQKAADSRVWDWQFPFFLGFNKFYFQRDYTAGADAILIAAQRPGAPKYLPTLAARLYKKEGRTESAIAFLHAFWENEPDARIKQNYEMRIDALKKIFIIEKAVESYRKRVGRRPATMEAMLEAGVMKRIPEDPYGGKFYLDKDGSVNTTSDFVPKRVMPQETE